MAVAAVVLSRGLSCERLLLMLQPSVATQVQPGAPRTLLGAPMRLRMDRLAAVEERLPALEGRAV
jgi:hypothetical protein